MGAPFLFGSVRLINAKSVIWQRPNRPHGAGALLRPSVRAQVIASD